MRFLLPSPACPSETATCNPPSSSGLPPSFPLVGRNFAFQYDEDNARWELYLVDFATMDDATVYGSLIWVTEFQQVYADAPVVLSTAMPSDVSIATLGYNYKFQNNYLYLANYDLPGTWHKAWVTADQQVYVDEGEA